MAKRKAKNGTNTIWTMPKVDMKTVALLLQEHPAKSALYTLGLTQYISNDIFKAANFTQQDIIYYHYASTLLQIKVTSVLFMGLHPELEGDEEAREEFLRSVETSGYLQDTPRNKHEELYFEDRKQGFTEVVSNLASTILAKAFVFGITIKLKANGTLDLSDELYAAIVSECTGYIQFHATSGLTLLESLEQYLQGSANVNPQRKKYAHTRDKAEEIGAITTLDNTLTSPSDKRLQFALSTEVIRQLPKAAKDCTFDAEGRLIQTLDNRPLEEISDIHVGLLSALLTIVEKTYNSSYEETNIISFHVRSFCEETKIDGRPSAGKRKEQNQGAPEEGVTAFQKSLQELPADGSGKARARATYIRKLAASFDNYVGRTPDGSFYRVLSFLSYDPATDTMEFSAPYLFKLIAMMDPKKMNKLLFASVANERNQAAVEVANRILNGLLRKGTRIAAPWHASFKTIIDDCPMLKAKLLAARFQTDDEGKPIMATDIEGREHALVAKNSSQLRNNILRSTFEAAYRIIMEKSRAPLYYKDFAITAPVNAKGEPVAPTNSTLSDQLVISHKGRNRDFSDAEYTEVTAAK